MAERWVWYWIGMGIAVVFAIAGVIVGEVVGLLPATPIIAFAPLIVREWWVERQMRVSLRRLVNGRVHPDPSA